MTERDRPFPQRTVPVFVYGSLQPGLHNYSMAEKCLVGEPIKARITGFRLYSNLGGSYPYLARGGSGTVTGTLLELEEGKALQRIAGMEIGAGYDASYEAIEVWLDSRWQESYAYVFVHREEWASHRGELVESGDWKAWYEEKNPGPKWWEDFSRFDLKTNPR
jgi:gamma-glutamylcyclotransferase (GGCT)/AIG2-like uncharacterized protein YtfP